MFFSYFLLFSSPEEKSAVFRICQHCFLYLSQVDRSRPCAGCRPCGCPSPSVNVRPRRLAAGSAVETPVQGAVPLGGSAKLCLEEPARLARPAGHEGPLFLPSSEWRVDRLQPYPPPPAWKDAKTPWRPTWVPRGGREPAPRNRGASRFR